MMERKVIVTAIVDHEVLVRVQQKSVCHQCAGKSSCSTLGAWANRVAEIRVRNTVRAEAGDEIMITMPDGLLLRAAWRVYGIPMVAFIVAGMIFQKMAQTMGMNTPDLWAACGGILALAGCYGRMAWHSRHHQQEEDTGIRILRIVQPATSIPIILEPIAKL